MSGADRLSGLGRLAAEAGPLDRYALSDGMHAALEQVAGYCAQHLPGAQTTLHSYPTGASFNHWTVGPKWELIEASLRNRTRGIDIDLTAPPLGVMLYSKPVQAVLDKSALAAHCRTRPDLPEAIPYVFRQQYRFWENDWGFCLPHRVWESLPDDAYEITIRTRETPGALEALEVHIPGERPAGPLLVLHLCHRNQANDGFSGALAALAALQDFLETTPEPRRSHALLFTTEAIGTAAFLHAHPDAPDRFGQAVCLSWCGQEGGLAFTHSRRGGVFDRIAEHVLANSGQPFTLHAYGRHGIGDEYIVDSPGIAIPCCCLQRDHPRDWYHTSLDTMDRFSLENVVEAGECLARMLALYDRDWIPVRRFTGMPCLSNPELGLYLEPVCLNNNPNTAFRQNRGSGLNDFDQYLFMNTFLHDVDGVNSVFEISQKHGVPFEFLDTYLREFQDKGLVAEAERPTPTPAPGCPGEQRTGAGEDIAS